MAQMAQIGIVDCGSMIVDFGLGNHLSVAICGDLR
jgi:hypothetical protein